MSSLQPIVVYGDFASPNPAKIRIILDELKLPYRNELMTFPEAKEEAYLRLNPNGRLPAVVDPNTGVTLWETGAITLYLIEQYDKDYRLSYETSPEKYQIQQWIAFQISGQGPYYGQGVWFNFFHSEKLPSAIERYEKEIERVRSVLDSHLTQKASSPGSETWLVGDKCTVADLSFIMWEYIAQFVFDHKGIQVTGTYPAYDAWIKGLLQRPASQEAIANRLKEMAKGKITAAVRDDMKADIEKVLVSK